MKRLFFNSFKQLYTKNNDTTYKMVDAFFLEMPKE